MWQSPQMCILGAVVACAVFVWNVPLVAGRVVYGMADSGEVAQLASFCFNIPRGKSGSIHSQTLADGGDQQLFVFSETHSVAPEIGDGLTPPPLLHELPCNALASEARVVENLIVPESAAAYDLHLAVDADVSGRNILAMAARCGSKLSLSYRLEFTNPGSFLVRHFSCNEQGVLQMYGLLLPIITLGATTCYALWAKLSAVLVDGPGSTAIVGGYLAAGFMWASVILHFLHVVAFSADGTGIPLLRLFAVFFDFCFNFLFAVVLVTLSIGDGIGQILTAGPVKSMAPLYGNETAVRSEESIADFSVSGGGTFNNPAEERELRRAKLRVGKRRSDWSAYAGLRADRSVARGVMLVYITASVMAAGAGALQLNSVFLFGHLSSLWSTSFVMTKLAVCMFIYLASLSWPLHQDKPLMRAFVKQCAVVSLIWSLPWPFMIYFFRVPPLMRDFIGMIVNFACTTKILIFFQPDRIRELLSSPSNSSPNEKALQAPQENRGPKN